MVDYKHYIDADPKVMLGKPKVKGTRITVELILRKLSGGYSPDEILAMYPHLTTEHILACLAYATAVLESEEVILAA